MIYRIRAIEGETVGFWSAPTPLDALDQAARDASDHPALECRSPGVRVEAYESPALAELAELRAARAHGESELAWDLTLATSGEQTEDELLACLYYGTPPEEHEAWKTYARAVFAEVERLGGDSTAPTTAELSAMWEPGFRRRAERLHAEANAARDFDMAATCATVLAQFAKSGSSSGRAALTVARALLAAEAQQEPTT